MNFSEFKKLLGADPLNKEPETLRARDSGPEFEQAAVEAEEFEHKLKAAADLPVNTEALVTQILTAKKFSGRQRPHWLAIAASLIVVAGVAGLIMVDRISQPNSIEEYVARHYAHDGEKFLAMAMESESVEAEEIGKLMASWGLETNQELNVRVKFIEQCPTMEGSGAHMIVQTEQGMITLIVMPNTEVRDRELIEFNGMHAYLVSLGDSSAAIIGRADQSVSSVEDLVRHSIFKST